MSDIGISTSNLKKHFGDIKAVDGVELKIRKGELFGLLGPNGAGKSTAIKMLATLIPPSEGTATILDYDLKTERAKIRELIGYCPQELVLFEKLTARENIHLIAQMHNIHPVDYKERTDELLGQMNLLDRANDQVNTFSGGMKRRVNILMAVVHDPEVIFFDEPSAGLDPQSRRVVWDFIKDFEKQKKTVILTTHNMEEADDLSEKLVIIDHGKVIAEGTPQELKGTIGEGDIIEFRLLGDDLNMRSKIVAGLQDHDDVIWAKELGKERISFSSLDGLRKIGQYYDFLDKNYEMKVRDLVIRQNTLEDVFINLTGRALRN